MTQMGLFTYILEMTPAGIEDAGLDVGRYSVNAGDGQIIITSSGAESYDSTISNVETYTLAGQLLRQLSLSGISTTIPLSAGLYFVRIGSESIYKVAVR